MPAAMATRHPRMVGRRPILSATPPSSSEPAAMPSNSMDSTQPRIALSIPQSLAIPGEAKLIESTSKPSSAFRPTVTSTATHCAAPMAPSSMMDFGLPPLMFPLAPGDRACCSCSLLVDASEELDQLGHFFFGEARLEPLLMLVDGALGHRQRLAPAIGQVQRLLASVAARLPAHQVTLRLEPVHDGHGRRAVHAHALRETGLRDVRMVIDQPQRRDLLLRQVEVREGLGEMPIDGAVGQADVKAHDIADLADVLIPRNVRCGDGHRVSERLWHRPTPVLIV